MNDIGPSSDWRSGQDRPGMCSLCERIMDSYYLETCTECGRVVCPDCYVDEGRGAVCLVCDEGVLEAV